MARTRTNNPTTTTPADRIADCAVTIGCWIWFTCGFILFFSWAYVIFAVFAKDVENRFQRLNCNFFRVLFQIIKTTSPRQAIDIDDEVASLRSSVIVCNHLSYLDPLLLIALYPQQKTIVKPRFFSMAIFGWIIRKSGYFPGQGDGAYGRLMIEQLEGMGTFLKNGGNLFVFPEGTRSRDGRLATLQKGALKIARLYKAPICVLEVANTNRLFTPGRFLFNTRTPNRISLKLIDRIEPDFQPGTTGTKELEERIRRAYGKAKPADSSAPLQN